MGIQKGFIEIEKTITRKHDCGLRAVSDFPIPTVFPLPTSTQ